MDGLTINQAAALTGWSPRMLRYLERGGLVDPQRNSSGYRLFGAAELQRLRTLRELLGEFDCGLSDVAFAARLRDEPALREALDGLDRRGIDPCQHGCVDAHQVAQQHQ